MSKELVVCNGVFEGYPYCRDIKKAYYYKMFREDFVTSSKNICPHSVPHPKYEWCENTPGRGLHRSEADYDEGNTMCFKHKCIQISKFEYEMKMILLKEGEK